MSVPTPNWILNEDHIIYGKNGGDTKILKEGTFARPINLSYVPDYIKELPSNQYFNPDKETYVYTPLGIIIVPLTKLSKT